MTVQTEDYVMLQKFLFMIGLKYSDKLKEIYPTIEDEILKNKILIDIQKSIMNKYDEITLHKHMIAHAFALLGLLQIMFGYKK